MRHVYCSYGLTLESDLPVAGLSPLQSLVSKPDISLYFAATPDWVTQTLALPVASVRMRPSSIAHDSAFTISEFADRRFFQLAYGDGTRFLMDSAATRMWGLPGPGLTYDDLFIYLLGPVMGFVLRQRGIVCLHASSIAFGDCAVALVGEAGAGKSTTAAALALRGKAVLAEDVCGLAESYGRYRVLPAYPRVCLWPDSVEFLLSSSDALPLMVHGWEKRFLALDGIQAQFASSGAPLVTIFLLAERSVQQRAPYLESISQREALLQLVQNTYMNWYLDRRQRAEEFDVLTRIVSSIECYRIVPSADPMRLPALAELIEKQVSRLSPRTHGASEPASRRV